MGPSKAEPPADARRACRSWSVANSSSLEYQAARGFPDQAERSRERSGMTYTADRQASSRVPWLINNNVHRERQLTITMCTKLDGNL